MAAERSDDRVCHARHEIESPKRRPPRKKSAQSRGYRTVEFLGCQTEIVWDLKYMLAGRCDGAVTSPRYTPGQAMLRSASLGRSMAFRRADRRVLAAPEARRAP
jgi:hypothetical protein